MPTPPTQNPWRGPRWALAVLLALLGMLGPFSIDTYLPAFNGIAKSLDASTVQMQQTLSAYLFGFAFMNLFHGALSDSFGRRPVILWGLTAFTLACAGCALSQTVNQLIAFRALQGLSCGAGVVVSRAIVRDIFLPSEAQRVMSQITIFFGIAPAIAPVLGGWFFVWLGWRSIFWLLAGIGLILWFINWRVLPETLPAPQRQTFHIVGLMRSYWLLFSDPRFLLLALASGVPFNGMFLYVLSAPVFMETHLQLGPTEFFWLFLCVITGIVSGAWVSGRLAGKIPQKRQIHYGFLIMLLVSLASTMAHAIFDPHAIWALPPIGVFSFGWALMVPVVTLLVLDLHPQRRGLASSLQAVVASTANGVVAGLVAPLVMHSTVCLAAAALALMLVGLFAWLYLHHRWPEIGH